MKINRKIMMISIIALMSFTPLMSIVTSSNGREVVEAAAIIYHTVGQNRIKVVKNTNFVNAQGTKQSAGAERGVSYPIYAIKNINGVPYLSVQKSNRYWLPVSAIKGTVTYKKDSFIYTITANNNQAQIVKPHATTASNAGDITLLYDAYVYNSEGKRVDNGLGKYSISKGTRMRYYGIKEIKGKKYYNIGAGEYVNAGNVKELTSTSVKLHTTTYPTTVSAKASLSMPRGKNTIVLKKVTYAYDAKGKRMCDYLGYSCIKKGTVLNYYGTKKINGKTFYYIGDNAYINSANVGKVINK